MNRNYLQTERRYFQIPSNSVNIVRPTQRVNQPAYQLLLFFFRGSIPRDETLSSSLTRLTIIDESNQISLPFPPNVDSQPSKTAKARNKHFDEGPVLKNTIFSLPYQLVLSCSEQFSSTLAALCSILCMYIPINLSPKVVQRQ